MIFPITALYAGMLAFIAIVLQQLVGKVRLPTKVSINDGGNPTLAAAMRRQANFIENVPLALILLALVEANGLGVGWLHALGTVLVVSRLVHPFGIHPQVMQKPARLLGALGTAIVILVAAVVALSQGISAL
jgi:uncharacterized membrane protein YecN with MAPEG domain